MERQKEHRLRANIWKLYILSALHGALFIIPVIIPFLRENGISLTQAFLLEAIFSIEVVILEIPTGYLSDRWHRKSVIVAASAFSAMGLFCFAIGTAFAYFLAGELLMGIGASLFSGTVEAITYDTLLEQGRTDEYKRISGRQYFSTFGAEALVSVIGGLVAVSGLRAVAWLTVLSPSLAFLVAFTLTEPARHKLIEPQHFKAIWHICTSTLIHNAPLRSIIALQAVIGFMTLTLFWLSQPYQMAVGLPIALFGFAHAIFVGGGALCSQFTHVIAKRIDDRMFLFFIAVSVVLSYFGLGFSLALWSLVFFLIGRIAWGFLTPLTSDMVNRMTTSDIRATVLSIRALGWRLLFALASPFIGYAADAWSLRHALLLTGSVGGIAIVITFLLMQSIWRKIPA